MRRSFVSVRSVKETDLRMGVVLLENPKDLLDLLPSLPRYGENTRPKLRRTRSRSIYRILLTPLLRTLALLPCS